MRYTTTTTINVVADTVSFLSPPRTCCPLWKYFFSRRIFFFPLAPSDGQNENNFSGRSDDRWRHVYARDGGGGSPLEIGSF